MKKKYKALEIEIYKFNLKTSIYAASQGDTGENLDKDDGGIDGGGMGDGDFDAFD